MAWTKVNNHQWVSSDGRSWTKVNDHTWANQSGGTMTKVNSHTWVGSDKQAEDNWNSIFDNKGE